MHNSAGLVQKRQLICPTLPANLALNFIGTVSAEHKSGAVLLGTLCNAVPIWMWPKDDVSRGKFSPGCIIERTTKEEEVTLMPEFVSVEITFDFQAHFFAKKARIHVFKFRSQ